MKRIIVELTTHIISVTAICEPIRRSRKRCYIATEKRIRTLCNRYQVAEISRLEFLSAVGHCVENVSIEDPSSDHSDFEFSVSDEDEGNNRPADDDNSNMINDVTNSSSNGSTDDGDSNLCQVCLLVPKSNVVLVPCGHARFCTSCVNQLEALNARCPMCRADIQSVINIYQ